MRAGNQMAALFTAAALALTGVGVAQAGVAQPTLVSTNPANFTPDLFPDNAEGHPAAYGVEVSGGTTYVGGSFHTVAKSGTNYTRNNAVAFSRTTGAISSFAPSFNGAVWAIRASGTSIYAAGTFTTVNGVPRRGVVKLTTTGAVDLTFDAHLGSGFVNDLQLVNGRLLVGGSLPGYLLALNPATGANTGYLNLSIRGTEPYGGRHVYRFAVNNAGTRLVAIGNFLTVKGQPRERIFMVDLDTTATLDPWYYQPFANDCALPKVYPAYLRDVDFAPDGSYFVVATTGYVPVSGGVGRDVCDAAARFEINIANPFRPTWINYTGGDTLHSVIVTGAAVYVQGHQRWLDNPNGRDSCVTTCVSRPGIGAINPTTGRAMSWNPTKTRGVGGKDLLSTAQGLWVASDGTHIGHEFHYGIAFLPL